MKGKLHCSCADSLKHDIKINYYYLSQNPSSKYLSNFTYYFSLFILMKISLAKGIY